MKTYNPKVIVVVNQKGGVAKSTVAFHLAHAAATLNESGCKVLCLDFDSQGNFSKKLSGDQDIIDSQEGGVGALLEGGEFIPSTTAHPMIDLLHGDRRLDRYDNVPAIEDRGYSETLRVFLHNQEYDYIIIDTPPAAGVRQMAPLCWADLAVIPTTASDDSTTGFQDVLDLINNDVSHINPNLQWCCVMTCMDTRIKLHREKEAAFREAFEDNFAGTLLSRSAVMVAMEEYPVQPIWERKGVAKEIGQQWLSFCKRVLVG